MDTNLEIYEPYQLAGSPSINTQFDENIDNTVENSNGSKLGLLNDEDELRLLNDDDDELVRTESQTEERKEYGGESGEEEAEEEEVIDQMDEESTTSLLDWFSICSSTTELAHKTGWTKYGVEAEPWADDKQNVFNVLDYEDFILTVDEEDGILSDRMVLAGSSFLDKNPESNDFTLSKLVMNEKGLTDITILGAHRYLQYIDLSRNFLTDLSALSNVPYLMHLDVSHNELTSVLQFEPPWNLSYVNYSYNNVAEIDDLSEFWSLVQLDLSFNEIVQIQGLENLRYLNDLNLSHNEIERFENLSNLHIEYLNISHNRISTFEVGPGVGMKTMLNLTFFDISANNLTTLALFQGVYHMVVCRVCQNQITELLEIEYMKSMRKLTDLDFTGNAITQWPRYRDVLVYTIPSLCYLDDSMVETREKIAATFLFEPDTGVSAACNRAHLILLEGLNEPSLELDILPVDQGNYPLVVLVGPPGSKKANLLDLVVCHLETRVCRGVNHTSREKDQYEVDGVDYYFVTQEKFNELTRKGEFLCISESLGNSCGFSRTELAKSVKQGKLCITHMDVLEALTLKARGLEPHLVLTISESETLHLERLREKYVAQLYYSVSGSATGEMSGAVSVRRRPDEYEPSVEQIPTTDFGKYLGMDNLSSYSEDSFLASYYALKEMNSNEDDANYNIDEEYFQLDYGQDMKNYTDEDFIRKYADEDPVKQLIDNESSEKEIKAPSVDSNLDFSQESSGFNVPQKIGRPTATTESSRLEELSAFGFNERSSNTAQDYFNSKPPFNRGRTGERQTVSFASGYGDTCDDNNERVGETQSSHLADQEGSYQSEATFSNDGSVAPSHAISDMPEKTGSGYSLNEQSVQDSGGDIRGLNISQQVTSPQAVMENYISSVLKTRASTLNIHQENPGLFSETVYTDNLDEAFAKLQQIVKETYISRPRQYPTFKMENDPAYKTMILHRLEKFKEDIYSDHSTSDKQIEDIMKYKLPRIAQPRRGSVLMKDIPSYGPLKQKQKCKKC